jgi:Na+-driven multidrug efflux pump
VIREFWDAIHWTADEIIDMMKWLNDPDTVRPVVEIGVWSATFFFTMFFIIMLVLRPRNKVDVGFTWLVGSVAAVLLRVVTLYYTHIHTEPIVTLIIWGNVTASVVYTTVVYVQYKWHKWHTLRAVRNGYERRSGIDRRKEDNHANEYR